MNPRRKGVTILLAIMAISLAGAAILILSLAAEAMNSGSDQAYARACSRNMLASGAAWASLHRLEAERLKSKQVLNVADLHCPGELVVLPPSSGTIHIRTLCRKGAAIARETRGVSLAP